MRNETAKNLNHNILYRNYIQAMYTETLNSKKHILKNSKKTFCFLSQADGFRIFSELKMPLRMRCALMSFINIRAR